LSGLLQDNDGRLTCGQTAFMGKRRFQQERALCGHLYQNGLIDDLRQESRVGRRKVADWFAELQGD